MTAFKAKRIVRSHPQHLNAAPARVFPLLCPTREYEWIESWRCDLVYSVSGLAEEDCIFITDHPAHGGRDVWVVSRYAPDQEIEFIRVNEARVIRYTITVEDNGDGTSTAVWTQVITALNEHGNAFIDHYSEGAYRRLVQALEKALNHFLDTGEMLKAEEKQ